MVNLISFPICARELSSAAAARERVALCAGKYLPLRCHRLAVHSRRGEAAHLPAVHSGRGAAAECTLA